MTQERSFVASDWINATDAAALLGISAESFRSLVRTRSVSTRRIPGTRAKYLRSDVERVGRESITPAAVG